MTKEEIEIRLEELKNMYPYNSVHITAEHNKELCELALDGLRWRDKNDDHESPSNLEGTEDWPPYETALLLNPIKD